MGSVTFTKAGYEIRFSSLFQEGRGLAFPCDAEGHVDLDDLSDAARNNYLYARALVGREFATPSVQQRNGHYRAFTAGLRQLWTYPVNEELRVIPQPADAPQSLPASQFLKTYCP